MGLKEFRSVSGRVDPNKYWVRESRPKCPRCDLRVRGTEHSVTVQVDGKPKLSCRVIRRIRK